MSTPPNPLPDTPATQAALAPTRPLYWSLRRELWENRSIYIAPLSAAGVMLAGFLINSPHLAGEIQSSLALDPDKQSAAISMTYSITAMLLMLISFIVGAFYSLDALYSERRDRSILFWKSLPVSDVLTVLSKVMTALVVLPLVAFAVIVSLHVAMLLIGSAALLVSGASAAPLWAQLPLFSMELVLLHSLLAGALWYAPLFAWLFLVSAWAKRAALLWAILPPLAVMILEGIAFHTSNFAALLKYRFTGDVAQAFVFQHGNGGTPIIPVTSIDPFAFLASSGLWTGLIAAAVMLAGAVWLRRNREPI